MPLQLSTPSQTLTTIQRLGRAGLRLSAVLALSMSPLWAQTTLPPEVDQALRRAKLPADAVSLLVMETQSPNSTRLSHRSEVPVNPASIMKLVTTYAALDSLGPAFTWNTPVFVDGVVRDGTLQGNLVIKGQGDPKLVVERLWLLLRRVQGLGISRISGDIVLDRSAFEVSDVDPALFDGEPLRPYNVAPDALLLNYKSVVLTFVPDPTSQRAWVSMEPHLTGVQAPSSVALIGGDCSDYRTGLKADFSDPNRIRLGGGFPASCGERAWPLAYADPRSYSARAVEAMWRELGGQLEGKVRDGVTPAGLKPSFEIASPALAEVVRDINKFSNNVMAQQLFLTLSLQAKGQGSVEASREWLGRWWRDRVARTEASPMPLFDNGSGLSRQQRISASQLARLLQVAWNSPLMPELLASLPVAGIDGTLKRSKTAGVAHLKTGSLRDVAGVAGIVHGASGRRYILVAIANHPAANTMRPVIDALVDWTARDR